MSVIWQYSPEVISSLPPLSPEKRRAEREELITRRAKTLARIDAQVKTNIELERERRQALEWCRANGNPHLKDAS